MTIHIVIRQISIEYIIVLGALLDVGNTADSYRYGPYPRGAYVEETYVN